MNKFKEFIEAELEAREMTYAELAERMNCDCEDLKQSLRSGLPASDDLCVSLSHAFEVSWEFIKNVRDNCYGGKAEKFDALPKIFRKHLPVLVEAVEEMEGGVAQTALTLFPVEHKDLALEVILKVRKRTDEEE